MSFFADSKRAFIIGFKIGILVVIAIQAHQSHVDQIKSNEINEKLIEFHLKHNASEASDNDDTNMADKLFEGTKVLCLIMTQPKNHRTKAIHVKNTWGKRCNGILFFSSQNDSLLETIAFPMEEGRLQLWQKTHRAFYHTYKHYLNEFDWFLKADDDTYVIMENLRYFLSGYSKNEPIILGCRTWNEEKRFTYMTGGAGYILSQKALKLLVEKSFENPNCGANVHGGEDIMMALCLKSVGVTFVDSVDKQNIGQMSHYPPLKHLIPGYLTNNTWFGRRVDHKLMAVILYQLKSIELI